MEAERCPICCVGRRPEPWTWCRVCGLAHVPLTTNLAWLRQLPPEAPRGASGCVQVQRADPAEATHYREASRDASIRIDVRPKAPCGVATVAYGACLSLGAAGALVLPSLVMDPSAPWPARGFGVLGLLAAVVALRWAWWVARDVLLEVWYATRLTAAAGGLRLQTWRGLRRVREVTLDLPRVQGVVRTPAQNGGELVWLLLREDAAVQIGEWLRPADAAALADEVQRRIPGARSPQ